MNKCPRYCVNYRTVFCFTALCSLSLFPYDTARLRNRELPSSPDAFFTEMFPFSLHKAGTLTNFSKLQTRTLAGSVQFNYNAMLTHQLQGTQRRYDTDTALPWPFPFLRLGRWARASICRHRSLIKEGCSCYELIVKWQNECGCKLENGYKINQMSRPSD